jgi:hypothetical protein
MNQTPIDNALTGPLIGRLRRAHVRGRGLLLCGGASARI